MNQSDANSTPPAAVSPGTSLAWVGGLTHWLIRRAARGAPVSLSERLEEEWLADLATRPAALSRLRFALGCCWAMRVIAHEHRASGLALAPRVLGAKVAIPHLHEDFSFLSRRSITLMLVVALHGAVFYGLMAGLDFNITKLISSPLQNQILSEPHPKTLPPPLPPPTLTHGIIDAVIPEFSPPHDPTEKVNVLTQPAGKPPQVPPPAHVVSRVPGGPGGGFPNTDDFYPSAAKRMEEQGVAMIGVCVDANGRLTSDPTTVQSSGSARLDEGALNLAKAGSGHYRASTEDGRPVNSCYAFRVRFQLRN